MTMNFHFIRYESTISSTLRVTQIKLLSFSLFSLKKGPRTNNFHMKQSVGDIRVYMSG
jgi:hypothetical protein